MLQSCADEHLSLCQKHPNATAALKVLSTRIIQTLFYGFDDARLKEYDFDRFEL